jgi:uncharacterized protein (AIM24 family)
VHDQLLGSTQPVLSISLQPGESVVAATGEFAWMTDSIQMTAGQAGLSAYLAKAGAGTVAFAARRPGAILSVEVAPGREFMVHRRAFLAGTPGLAIGTAFRQPPRAAERAAGEFILRRIGGTGRAWVELSGDIVRHDLRAGASLRARPGHIGMSDASVSVQVAELDEPAGRQADGQARQLAVLSGPGSVWLQSMPLHAAPCSAFRHALTEETEQHGALRTGCPPAGHRDHGPGRRRGPDPDRMRLFRRVGIDVRRREVIGHREVVVGHQLKHEFQRIRVNGGVLGIPAVPDDRR